MRKLLGLASSLCLMSTMSIAAAKTDTEVDPTHYKLELENECVRVIRATFGPHEKSPFYDTKPAVTVSLSNSHDFKLTRPNGNVVYWPLSTGKVYWGGKPDQIQLENEGDTRVEFVVIEVKDCKPPQ